MSLKANNQGMRCTLFRKQIQFRGLVGDTRDDEIDLILLFLYSLWDNNLSFFSS